MTIVEIREKLPTMVKWAAKAAVMEGVKAYHKAQKQYDIENQNKQSGKPYNFILAQAYNEGVRVAAEVLWKVFASCPAECQAAVAIVAKSSDGYTGHPDRYFDAFVAALETVQGHTVRIREKE